MLPHEKFRFRWADAGGRFFARAASICIFISPLHLLPPNLGTFSNTDPFPPHVRECTAPFSLHLPAAPKTKRHTRVYSKRRPGPGGKALLSPKSPKCHTADGFIQQPQNGRFSPQQSRFPFGAPPCGDGHGHRRHIIDVIVLGCASL